jgi:vacuolar-type H+-ATPase subunit I/STV1
MNWMDFEQLNTKLDKLELKSQVIEHILNRIKYLIELKTTDEYEYSVKLGRINELEELLKYFNEIQTTKINKD